MMLSALHGLVALDQRIEPYNHRLGGIKERARWARRIASTLIARHGRDVDYLVLAGQDYAGPLRTALRSHDGFRDGAWRGVHDDRILQPLQGLQVGERLRWLSEQTGGEA